MDDTDGARTVIQAKFETDELACISDVIHIDGNQIDLYEIKSSTSVKKEHIFDLAFQCEVIRCNGYDIRSVTVLTVNNQYVRQGEIDAEAIVNRDDVTESVMEKQVQTDVYISHALAVVNSQECPSMSFSNLGIIGSVGSWLSIIRYNKVLPENSVYDLDETGKNRLVEFESNGIELITDISESSSLTAKQELQLIATKTDKPIINRDAIKVFLDELEFLLYFLDYETYSAVVPYFDGQRPYMQVPFQYSLHIFRFI